MSYRHAVIVTAAGSSQRFNTGLDSNTKKEYLTINGKSILLSAVEPFTKVEGLCAIVIVYKEGDLDKVKALVGKLEFLTNDVKLLFVQGGETRQQSVFNGLKLLYEKNYELNIDLVSIHDGARPFIETSIIQDCLDKAILYGGSCPCIRVTDTLVKVNEDNLLSGRLDRNGVCRVQTPQTFKFPEIYQAHCQAKNSKGYTDDTEIFMEAGGKVAFVQGSEKNIKITYARDMKEFS